MDMDKKGNSSIDSEVTAVVQTILTSFKINGVVWSYNQKQNKSILSPNQRTSQWWHTSELMITVMHTFELLFNFSISHRSFMPFIKNVASWKNSTVCLCRVESFFLVVPVPSTAPAFVLPTDEWSWCVHRLCPEGCSPPSLHALRRWPVDLPRFTVFASSLLRIPRLNISSCLYLHGPVSPEPQPLSRK